MKLVALSTVSLLIVSVLFTFFVIKKNEKHNIQAVNEKSIPVLTSDKPTPIATLSFNDVQPTTLKLVPSLPKSNAQAQPLKENLKKPDSNPMVSQNPPLATISNPQQVQQLVGSIKSFDGVITQNKEVYVHDSKGKSYFGNVTGETIVFSSSDGDKYSGMVLITQNIDLTNGAIKCQGTINEPYNAPTITIKCSDGSNLVGNLVGTLFNLTDYLGHTCTGNINNELITFTCPAYRKITSESQDLIPEDTFKGIMGKYSGAIMSGLGAVGGFNGSVVGNIIHMDVTPYGY